MVPRVPMLLEAKCLRGKGVTKKMRSILGYPTRATEAKNEWEPQDGCCGPCQRLSLTTRRRCGSHFPGTSGLQQSPNHVM